MSVAGSQRQTFLRLLAALRPHWHRDPALPARIQALLAGDRRFGSGDRRLYRELIYTTLRHLPWIEPLLDSAPEEAVRRVAWLAADIKATRGFRRQFADGEPPAGDRAELLPAWFRPHCPEIFSGPELDAQLRRAPLWLRLQTADVRRVTDEFDARGWRWRQSSILPAAIEILDEADVTRTDAWREGRCEVQDLGSQLVLAIVGPETGERWLDACAGAGGKTLQLASLVGPAGTVLAHDIRPAALQELSNRVARSPFRNIAVTASPHGEFDGVLVDAPCSGSGTWRRSPHLKWVTTEATIATKAELQSRLLIEHARRVRPGGRLVYATCSLSSRENEAVAATFLAAHRDFRQEPPARNFRALPRGPGWLLLPAVHDTDGFFLASFRRFGDPPAC